MQLPALSMAKGAKKKRRRRANKAIEKIYELYEQGDQTNNESVCTPLMHIHDPCQPSSPAVPHAGAATAFSREGRWLVAHGTRGARAGTPAHAQPPNTTPIGWLGPQHMCARSLLAARARSALHRAPPAPSRQGPWSMSHKNGPPPRGPPWYTPHPNSTATAWRGTQCTHLRYPAAELARGFLCGALWLSWRRKPGWCLCGSVFHDAACLSAWT